MSRMAAVGMRGGIMGGSETMQTTIYSDVPHPWHNGANLNDTILRLVVVVDARR